MSFLTINMSRYEILCFVDRASRYNCVKKNQLDAQLVVNIYHQPVHVSGVSRPIIRRHNRMYTAVGTYCSVCCAGWIVPIQPAQQKVI